jgi:hypothetical protein
MTTTPHIAQTRRAIRLTNGTMMYEVTTVVIDPGDLPFKELFVVAVSDSPDPKDDVFARVATPYDIRQTDINSPRYIRVVESDLIRIGPDPFARIANYDELTMLQRDRTAAVQSSQTEYLTSVMTVQYPSLTTADAAYKQILSRLSSLVTDWRNAYSSFATVPSQDYFLPVANASVQAERVQTYLTARAARVATEDARDAAQTSLNECEQRDTANQTIYGFLVADVSFLENARSVVANITETATATPPSDPAVTTTNAKNFVLQLSGYAGDPRSYQALLDLKRQQLATYARQVADGEEECDRFRAALLDAQAAVVAAQTAERNALADVYAVCPTYTPPSS